MTNDLGPLPWGEGGESSEPGEGFLHIDPRNFGIRDHPHPPYEKIFAQHSSIDESRQFRGRAMSFISITSGWNWTCT